MDKRLPLSKKTFNDWILPEIEGSYKEQTAYN